MLESIEGRIQRALLGLGPAPRDLLDAQQDSVAAQGCERHGLQDQDIEGALQHVEAFGHRISSLCRPHSGGLPCGDFRRSGGLFRRPPGG